jgi:hypothetical protein
MVLQIGPELSSNLLSEKVKIEVYTTIVLRIVLSGLKLGVSH